MRSIVPRSIWTKERVAALTTLWVVDGLSASQIAVRLGGVTRNAVIGKAHRLKLNAQRERRSPQPRYFYSKSRRGGPSSPLPRGQAVSPSCPEGGPGHLPARTPRPSHNLLCLGELADLAGAPDDPAPGDRISVVGLLPRHCRWPFGDPQSSDFGHCGRPRHQTLPYCADHARIAYRDPAKRRSAV